MDDDDYFSIALEPQGHVRLAGEFDLNARDELREALLDAVARNPGDGVVVDLAAVTFIDSEAIGAVLDGYLAAQEAGIGFRLSNATGVVRRVFTTIDVPGLSV